MKLTYFCNEYPPKPHGGIGTFVKIIAEAMTENGHTVQVIEFGEKQKKRIENNVKIITLKQSTIPKLAWLINRIKLWTWLNHTILKKEIDIFELPEYQGWLPLPVIKQNSTIIIRLHQSATAIKIFAHEKISKPEKICEYLTLFFHQNWIGVSKYIINLTTEIFDISSQKSCVIYNPVTISPQTIAALPKYQAFERPYILFVGSMTERKGVLTLARAAKILCEGQTPIYFVFIGQDTTYNNQLISREMSNIMGSENQDWLIFKGHLTHAETLWWMRDAVAVALPSQLEAFSLVPLEAMSIGTPIIYTKAASGTEIIQHSENGLLINPDDSKELSIYISNLMNNPQYSKELVDNGRKTVEKKFNIGDFVSNTLNFYYSRKKNQIKGN